MMLTLHPSNLPNVELFVNIFWDTYLTIHNKRNFVYLYIQYLLYLFLDYLNDSEKYSSLCLLNVIVGGLLLMLCSDKSRGSGPGQGNHNQNSLNLVCP